MLKSQNLDLQFISGADSKTSDKHVQFISFRELVNGRVDRLGTLVPRGGARVLSSTYASRTYDASDLAASPSQLAYLANNKLNSVVPELEALVPETGVMQQVSTAIPGSVKRLYAGQGFSYYGMAGIPEQEEVCLVWVPTTNFVGGTTDVGVMITNVSTGEIVMQTLAPLANITDMSVVSDGTNYFILYRSGGTMAAAKINRNSLSSPFSTVTWGTSITASNYAAVGVSGAIYLHYGTSGSANTSLAKLSVSGTTFTVTTASNILTFGAADPKVGICLASDISSGVVAAMGVQGTTAKGVIYNSLLSVVGSTQSQTVIATQRFACYQGNGYANLWLQSIDGTTQNMSFGTFKMTSSTSSYTTHTTNGPIVTAVAGPCMINGLPLTVVDSRTVATYGSQAIIDVTGGYSTSLATIGIGVNPGQYITFAATYQLPAGITTTSGISVWPSPVVSEIVSFGTPDTSSGTVGIATPYPDYVLSVVVYDSTAKNTSVIDTTNNQSNYIGAQSRILSASDQIAGVWPEINLEISSHLSVIAGGSLNGTYSHVFAKLYKSPLGQEYRVWSPIYTCVFANQYLRVSKTSSNSGMYWNGPVNAIMEAYRTEADGTIFYLHGTFDPASATYSMSAADSVIIQNRVANINGGELASEPIPSARLSCKFQDRIAIVPADEPDTIWFNRPGAWPQGTSFSTGITYPVANPPGDITAIAEMDAALYVFKRNSISAIWGEPAGSVAVDTGTLTKARLMYSGIGCNSPRSVVLTPDGLMFQSGKGFHILQRGGNSPLIFIGAGPYGDRDIQITGATMAEDTSEVMFSFENGSTWVYNFDTKGWYEWQLDSTVRGLATFQNDIYMAQDNGVLRYSTDNTTDSETGSANLDIPLDATTGWLKLNGIAGFQRIRHLVMQVEILTNCTLTVDVYTDYNATSMQTVTIDTSMLASTNPTEIDIHLKVQKCEAISFRFQTDKYGLKLNGATLTVAVKEGKDKSRKAPNNY